MSHHHSEKQRSSAGALGAKTARACDNCLRRRARWYCAADDAFLCQACDSSVHSANPLARRHHRLRLKTSSSSSSSFLPSSASSDDAPPPWLHGFRRKARTPRGKPAQARPPKLGPLVPDLEADEKLYTEEEHLLYRVPIFDPVLAEFCSPPVLDDANALTDEAKPAVQQQPPEHADVSAADAGFHPSDLDLAEFAADVESLLGRGLDDDKFCIDELGLVDSAEGDDKGRVKLELDVDGGGERSDVMACDIDMEIDLSQETLDLDFGCGSPAAGEELEEQKAAEEAAMAMGGGCVTEAVAAGRGMILRLDYEAVVAAWSCKGCSPWTDGERPQFNPDDCWPDFAGMMWGGAGGGGGAGGEVAPVYGEVGMIAGDGGREAKVTRYREKRRTRLFSKKIRYEVRKLNAEKRPRMKGRFVKRTAFPASGPAAAPFPF